MSGFHQKGTKRSLRVWWKGFFVVKRDKNVNMSRTLRAGSSKNQVQLIIWLVLFLLWGMVVASSCLWGLWGFSIKYWKILKDNMLQTLHNLRLGWWYTSQHDQNHTTEATDLGEWSRFGSSRMFERPWRDQKTVVHKGSSTNQNLSLKEKE